MTNLDIIKTFESQEMGKFLATVAMQHWNDWKINKEWLEMESADGKLRNGYMIWENEEWIFDKDHKDHFKHGNWVINHLPDVLEFLMSDGQITSSNVLVVIPTIEFNRRGYEDYKEIIHYKNVNFTIWSDFYDLDLDDIYSSREGEADYKKYLATYKTINFMKNFDGLVSTIKIYYKNK